MLDSMSAAHPTTNQGFLEAVDVDHRRVRARRCRQRLRKLDTGHPAELDVEDHAIELRPLGVGEKRLRRAVGDRLDAGRAQQPGE